MEIGFESTDSYGEILEDRGTQITFSALGQTAPVELKKLWDPQQIKRREIIRLLEQYLPEFEIRMGGATSIDVTQKGIDKAYGILQMQKYLGVTSVEMLFVGDALYEGGNDAPVRSAGVACLETSGPAETINIIRNILNE